MHIETFFEKNKYVKWYISIIKNAEQQNRVKNTEVIYELHHILPASIWKEYKNLTKNPWNGVLLTVKEHYIVHLLLVNIFKNNKRNYFKMINALNCFISFHYNRRPLLPSCKIIKAREKLSSVKKGISINFEIPHTQKTKEKLKNNHWTKNGITIHGMKNKKHNKNSIKKMKENRSIYKFTCISPSGIIYNPLSIKEFCVYHDLCYLSLEKYYFNTNNIVPKPQSKAKNLKRKNLTGWKFFKEIKF